MILVLAAFEFPFRALILADEGSIIRFFRPKKDTASHTGFFDSDFDLLVQGLLKDNIHPSTVKSVVIMGKPLIFFESFLQRSLLPPAPMRMARFPCGVKHYFSQGLLLKKRIFQALRHEPEFFFYPVLETFFSLPRLIGWNRGILFWGMANEHSTSAVLHEGHEKLETPAWIEDAYRCFNVTRDAGERLHILSDVIVRAKLDHGLVLSPLADGGITTFPTNFSVIGDATTLLLAAAAWDHLMTSLRCEEMVASFERDFRETFVAFDSSNNPGHLCNISRLWDAHRCFKIM